MTVLTWIVWQLYSYGIGSWLAFVFVAFCAARYGRWWLIPVGHVVVAAIICFLDVCWIEAEMGKPGWDGTPDMDVVFQLGFLMRVLLINTVLLPITAIGIWLRRYRHASSREVQNT